jgi:membrane protease YdiL (CAAX protease family)
MDEIIKLACVILPFILNGKICGLLGKVFKNDLIITNLVLMFQILYLKYLFNIPFHFDSFQFSFWHQIPMMLIVIMSFYGSLVLFIFVTKIYFPKLIEHKFKDSEQKMSILNKNRVLASIVIPCLEEILFRYTYFILFQNSPWFHFGLSCILFSYLHCGDHYDFIQFFTTFTGSLILNYYFLCFSLHHSIFYHILNNSIVLIVLFFANRITSKQNQFKKKQEDIQMQNFEWKFTSNQKQEQQIALKKFESKLENLFSDQAAKTTITT